MGQKTRAKVAENQFAGIWTTNPRKPTGHPTLRRFGPQIPANPPATLPCGDLDPKLGAMYNFDPPENLGRINVHFRFTDLGGVPSDDAKPYI